MADELPKLTVTVGADVEDAVAGLAEVGAAEEALGKASGKTKDKIKSDSKESGSAIKDFTALVKTQNKDGENAYAMLRKAIDDTTISIKTQRADFARNGSIGVFGDIKKSEKDLAGLMDLAKTAGISFAQEGEKAATSFASEFENALASTPLSGPVGLGIAAGLAPTVVPVVTAMIAGAVSAGFGLGVIGVGAMSLKNNPVIKSSLNELKTNVAATFSGAASPLIGPLSSGLDRLDSTIVKLKPELTSLFGAASPAVGSLFDGLDGLINKAMPGFVKGMQEAAPILETIGRDLPGLGSALGGFIETVAQSPGDLMAMDDAFKILDNTITGVGNVLNFGANAYAHLSEAGVKVRGIVLGSSDAMGTFATQASTATASGIALGDAANAAGGMFNTQKMAIMQDDAELNKLISSMQAYTNQAQSADDSLLAMKIAQSTFNKELATGTKNWNENAAAGQKQVGNLNSANKAITGYYDTLAKGKPLTEAQTAAELKATTQLYKTATAAGATSAETATLRGEISRLTTELGLMKNKAIVVTLAEHFTASFSGGAVKPTRGYVAGFANSGIADAVPHLDSSGVVMGGLRPTAFFGEQSTGREAFVAENGDRNRALSSLGQAAGWHGMEMVPVGGGARGGGGDIYVTAVLQLDTKTVAKQLIGPVNKMNARSSTPIYGSAQ